MENARMAPLRVMYTINSSPQYILARATNKVLVNIVQFQPNPTGNSHYANTLPLNEAETPSTQPTTTQSVQYATTSLRICLDAICRSSPELVQDTSRDFSVYVLDPLESRNAPAPVHISQISESSHSLPQESPQAAQDTPHTRAVAVALGLMSWALLADESDSVAVAGTFMRLGTGENALEVVFALRETSHMQKASLPSAVKAWGLPPPIPVKRSKSMPSKHKHSSSASKANHLSATPRTTSFLVPSNSKQIAPSAPSSSADTATIYAKSSDLPTLYIGPPRRPRGRPGAGGSAHTSAKAAAAATSTAPPFSSTPLSCLQQSPVKLDPDIPPETLQALLIALSTPQNAALLAALASVDATPLGIPTDDPPNQTNAALANTLKQLLATTTNQSSQSQPLAHPPSRPPTASRTQDDDIVILDKENVNPHAFHRRTQKDSDHSNPTSEIPAEPVQQSPPHQVLSNARNNSKSPPSTARKRTLSEAMDTRERDRVTLKRIPGAPTSVSPPTSALPPMAASSPLRGPPRRFVVPEWARTTTTLQPRLSHTIESVLQQREAKRQEELRARKERRALLRRESSSSSGIIGRPRKHAPKAHLDAPKSESETHARSATLTTAASLASSSNFPVFASDISFGSLPSTPPAYSSTTIPDSEDIYGTPSRTPERKRLREGHDDDDDDDDDGDVPTGSLFTPTPRRKLRSMYDSPLFGKQSPSTKKVRERNNHPSQDDEENEELAMELARALEDVDTSTPIYFPTSELDSPAPKTSQPDAQVPCGRPSEPHWSIGLPPSSPPPPSSPVSFSGNLDRVTESVSTTIASDGEDESMNDSLPTGFLSDADGSCSEPEFGVDFAGTDFVGLFCDPSDTSSSGAVVGDDGELLLSQFMSGTQELSFGGDAIQQNGLVDLDFGEFWESVKPLVEGSTAANTVEAVSGADSGELDHTTFAEEVKALFSGCLV